jgi:hypothetical protein
MNLDKITKEPIAFDKSDEYTYSDLDTDDSLPPFYMSPEVSSLNPRRYKKLTNILSIDPSISEENEERDDEIVEPETPEYGSLDVIAVKQFHQSKMDLPSQIYVGSLTIIGLFVLFRYFRK